MRVTVRVKPGSSRNRVGGSYGDAGTPQLVVAVTARAVEGAATEAVLRALADALKVRRGAVRLVSGATSRTKVIDVDGDEEAVGARLRALLGGS